MISNKKATFNILDKMRSGETFSSIDLQKGVSKLSGKNPFIGTCIRYLREYRDTTHRQIINTSKSKSIYKVL